MRRRYVLVLSAIFGVLLLIGAYFALPLIFASVVVPLPEEYQPYLTEFGRKYNVNSCVLAAIAKIESNFNPRARSHLGAQGIGQMLTGTFNAMVNIYHIPNGGIYDPKTNIEAMTAYVDYNRQQYGFTLESIAKTYNGGGGLANVPVSRLPLETRFYIRKLDTTLRLYLNVYGSDFCQGPLPTGFNPDGGDINNYGFREFNAPKTERPIDLNNFYKNWLGS